MKRLFLATAALALASCATMPLGLPDKAAPVVAAAGTVILSGERGFAAAELAYITAADGVGRLADNDVITGSTATWFRDRNAEARRLIVKGKATADAVEKARLAAEIFGIADSINKRIGSK